MKTKKILILAGVTITAILVIRAVRSKKQVRKRRHVVADQGYETAEDILFPKRKFLRLS
jgi:hypothetical protein